MKRLIIPFITTLGCWLVVSIVTFGHGPFGYWDNLVWKLEQALHLDEELIVFSSFLLFSVSVSTHVHGFRFKARYRDRFMYPQLGILYSALALLVGSVLRHLFHDPFDNWFHLAYTLLSCAVFGLIFCAKFKRILIRETST